MWISVRQPWAALIVDGIKDVENRSWRTHYRGRVIIHASLTRGEPRLSEIATRVGVDLPNIDLPIGGFVGIATIADCVTAHASKWFNGERTADGKPNYGFVLIAARPLPFLAFAGAVGLRPVPQWVVYHYGVQRLH